MTRLLTKRDIQSRENAFKGKGSEGEKRLLAFTWAVDNGDTPHKDDINWLASAFRKILDGAQIEKALEINKGKGRKRTVLDHDGEVMTVAMVLTQMKKHGGTLTKDDAISDVAKNLRSDGIKGRSERTIRNLYDKHRVEAVGCIGLLNSLYEFRDRMACLTPQWRNEDDPPKK